ncbi:uncharacterized protein N7473_003833 [Penicillium subrubescens]|jgi:hypothetical protein|nr:uncharacterized protein N7473_003833 [Penicillium subrubescens]KAJ5906917.1 hypothetical protein N7473_003833 [Penicillium subrubescens]
MGMAGGRNRLLDLRHKRAESSISLADGQPSSISDQSSTKVASWFRVPKKDINLKSVNEQIEELSKTHNHITTQLNEAQRLRQLKEHGLDPSEMTWIDGTISDIEDATYDVAILLEPTRVEKATSNGKLSLGTQIRWFYRDSQRAQDKKHRLLACHSSLMAVLARLQQVDIPEAIVVHEMGTETSSKSNLCSSSSLQGSVDGFYEPMEGRQGPTVSGSLTREMYDMLAWRQSKGNSTP